MKKNVVFFVEGLGELLFIRNILKNLFNLHFISYDCIRLRGGLVDPFPPDHPNTHAEVHFMILDVGGDGTFLSAIKERKENFTKEGFSEFVVLRDIFSEKYDDIVNRRAKKKGKVKKKKTAKVSESVVDKEACQFIMNEWNELLEEQGLSDNLKNYWAIMELEAWWLSMYTLFENNNHIKEKLGYRLDEVKPEDAFYHPAEELKKIYCLDGMKYGKHGDQIESLTNKIKLSDIENAIKDDRCPSLKLFWDELTQIAPLTKL